MLENKWNIITANKSIISSNASCVIIKKKTYLFGKITLPKKVTLDLMNNASLNDKINSWILIK